MAAYGLERGGLEYSPETEERGQLLAAKAGNEPEQKG
jgi:hypothetical protein